MAKLKGGENLGPKLAAIGKGIASGDSVRIGFLERASYPDGTPVALVAAVQDFGAPARGIPPRPFFRDMIAERKAEWPAAIAALLKANDYDAARTLDQVGEAVAGQLRESIQKAAAPPYAPLAPATIKRKGFSKLLVDTGHMLNSVDHEVKTR